MSFSRFLLVSDVHGNIDAVERLVRSRQSQKDKFHALIISGDLPATVPFILISEYILRHRNLSRYGYSYSVYYKELRQQFVRMQLNSIRKMVPILQKLELPIFYVPGNVETRDAVLFIAKNYPEINLLDRNIVDFNSHVAFAGLGGSLEHLGRICDNEYSTGDFDVRIEQLNKKIVEHEFNGRRLVTVFHEPPKFSIGTDAVIEMTKKRRNRGYSYSFKDSVGSESLARVLLEHHPLLSINGHYHEFSGQRLVYQTPNVNPGALASYQYAIVTIKARKRNPTVSSKFFQIRPNFFSFIHFLYQSRVFHYGELNSHQ